MQVTIVKVPPITVAVLEHRGDPALVNDSVKRFIAWRKESGLSTIASSQTYGIAYDDPATTVRKDFRLDICGSVSETVPDNRYGIVTKTIPGGRCAVVRHQDPGARVADGCAPTAEVTPLDGSFTGYAAVASRTRRSLRKCLTVRYRATP